jgi:hypothetical protein
MFRNITIAAAILGMAAMFFLVTRLKKPDPVAPPLVEPAAAPYEAAIGAREAPGLQDGRSLRHGPAACRPVAGDGLLEGPRRGLLGGQPDDRGQGGVVERFTGFREPAPVAERRVREFTVKASVP